MGSQPHQMMDQGATSTGVQWQSEADGALRIQVTEYMYANEGLAGRGASLNRYRLFAPAQLHQLQQAARRGTEPEVAGICEAAGGGALPERNEQGQRKPPACLHAPA